MEFQLIPEMIALKTRVPHIYCLRLLELFSTRATAEMQTFPNAATLKLIMSFNNFLFRVYGGFDNLNLGLFNGMALLQKTDFFKGFRTLFSQNSFNLTTHLEKWKEGGGTGEGQDYLLVF